MKPLRRSIAMLLLIWLCMPLTQAQPAPDKQQEAQAADTIAQEVLIIIQQEQVRFTARKSVTEMQLQIFDQAGQLVYDSGAVAEPELTWALRQDDGEAVKSGLYAYTLSVKEAGAETARVRRGHFIVDRARERDGQTDRLWITSQNDSGVGTELTVARNEGVTIAGTSAGASPTAGEREDRKEHAGEKKAKTIGSPEGEVAALEVAGSGAPGRIAKFTSAEELGSSEIFEQNGKVGIGTTSPISKFHIASGASDNLPPRLQSSSTNTFAAGWDFYHGSTGVGYVGVPDGGTGIAPGEMLVYGVGTTSLWAGRQRGVTLNSLGNVGIGTANPFAHTRLHVIANPNSTAVYGESASGAGVIGTTTDGIGVLGYAGPDGYAGDFQGKVKIRGSLIPADRGSFDLGQEGQYWRFIYTAHIIQASDARLKKDVADLRYGLRELMQLRPVAYEWKDHSHGQQQLGLIAQETERIIPEAVVRAKDPAKPLGINYTALVPVVIKAIQQQQSDLTTLKKENGALQERNSALHRQNADLEARLMALEHMIQQVVGQAQNQAPVEQRLQARREKLTQPRL